MNFLTGALSASAAWGASPTYKDRSGVGDPAGLGGRPVREEQAQGHLGYGFSFTRLARKIHEELAGADQAVEIV